MYAFSYICTDLGSPCIFTLINDRESVNSALEHSAGCYEEVTETTWLEKTERNRIRRDYGKIIRISRRRKKNREFSFNEKYA